MKTICSILMLASLAACSSVTIRDKGNAKLSTEPTWSQSESFYFWGLAGTANVDVKQVCGTQKPTQLQTQATITDSLLTFITLGIYAPRTAKVWCE